MYTIRNVFHCCIHRPSSALKKFPITQRKYSLAIFLKIIKYFLGLGHEGIYRKNGAKSRIKLLMEEFRKDARNVKLRIGDNFIEDVTDVLKRFFREIDDPIFMADLHPYWKEAASQ